MGICRECSSRIFTFPTPTWAESDRFESNMYGCIYGTNMHNDVCYCLKLSLLQAFQSLKKMDIMWRYQSLCRFGFAWDRKITPGSLVSSSNTCITISQPTCEYRVIQNKTRSGHIFLQWRKSGIPKKLKLKNDHAGAIDNRANFLFCYACGRTLVKPWT